MDESLNQWFTREILVHERALVRYMTRLWPDRAEVADLCHDTYVRVYESAAKARPVSPRGFLFATARHLMADRVRRGKIVSIEMRGDLEALNVLTDDMSPERRLNARQDLWRLARAFGSLPSTCRDVMWLIKVEELTRKEIAERLKITPKAVEKRIERGVRLLEVAFFGAAGQEGDESRIEGSGRDGGTAEDESDHG
jgi:RNA polymerase sigma-70 factor (ECF subfamily)